MNIDINTVIILITLAIEIGIYFGYLTSKFQTKKECKIHREKIDERIDGIQTILVGGKYQFKVELITER